MGEKVIVKYENNEPVYADISAISSERSDPREMTTMATSPNDNSVNGCVAGPYCAACRWTTGYHPCPRGEQYCRKPRYQRCP
jgi:hypothetical protein